MYQGWNNTVLPRYDTYLHTGLTIRLWYDTYNVCSSLIYLDLLTATSRWEYIIQKPYISSIFLYHDTYLGNCIMIYRDMWRIVSPLIHIYIYFKWQVDKVFRQLCCQRHRDISQFLEHEMLPKDYIVNEYSNSFYNFIKTFRWIMSKF